MQINRKCSTDLGAQLAWNRLVVRSSPAVKRRTVKPGEPERESIRVGDALSWIWSCQLQARELAECRRRELVAFGELELVGISPEGVLQLVSATPPGQDEKKVFAEVSVRIHLFLVCARNALRAIDALGDHTVKVDIPEDLRKACLWLRNIYEHWDTRRGEFRADSDEKQRDAKKFSEKWPDAEPFSASLTEQDLVIGDVFSVQTMLGKLGVIERQLVESGAE